MNFQPNQNTSRDDDATVDDARLERLFSRRAHKAATYCRILLTTRSQPTAFGHGTG
jgi:hypothetical protein